MKKHFFITCFFLSFFSSFSQFSVAGVSGQYYFDINPDTALGIINGNISELFFVDINNDFNNDFKITAYRSQSGGGTVGYIKLESLNTESSLGLGTIDSTLNNSNGTWIIRNILKKYNLSDTIDSSTFVPISLGYIGYQYSTPMVNATSNQWVNAGEKFVGISFLDSAITKYGWIKVNVTYSSYCLVEEYSLGATYLNGLIKKTMPADFLLYPSPVEDLLFIEGKSDGLSVYNCLGEIMPVEILEIGLNKYRIDMRDLANGIYILRIIDRSNCTEEKVIVQH